MALQVVTHNGKPPSEGGLRIGYLANDPARGQVFLPIGALPSLAAIIAMPAYVPPTETVAPSAQSAPIRFADLRDYRTRYGDCSRCSSHVNASLARVVQTDRGLKTVYTCPDCGSTLKKWDE